MTRLYLIRHGETLWNREKRLQGHLDIGLNETGLWQAEQVGRHLAQRPLQAIISSDLSRAADTAQAIAQHHSISLQLDELLRERHYGNMQGLTYDEVAAHHPRNHLAWKNREPDFCPEGGESLRQFYERVTQSVLAWVKKHPTAEIAIVAHGGVLDCINRYARGIGLSVARDFEILNASLNTLTYQDAQLKIEEWGNTEFLKHQLNKSLDELDGSPKWA